MAMTLAEIEVAITELSSQVANLPTLSDIDTLSTLINSKHTTFLDAVNSLNSQVSTMRALVITLQKRIYDLENA